MKTRIAEILFGLVVLTGCSVSKAGLAPSATSEAILSLKDGMTYDQILERIGPPLEKRLSSDLSVGGVVYRRGSSVQDPSRGDVVLMYSRPLGLFRAYPMLWVHLKDGKLFYVNAKVYDGAGRDSYVKVSASNPLFWDVFGQ